MGLDFSSGTYKDKWISNIHKFDRKDLNKSDSKRISMRSRGTYKVKGYYWNDNYHKIYKFLNKNVNRPFDKVFSELNIQFKKSHRYLVKNIYESLHYLVWNGQASLPQEKYRPFYISNGILVKRKIKKEKEVDYFKYAELNRKHFHVPDIEKDRLMVTGPVYAGKAWCIRKGQLMHLNIWYVNSAIFYNSFVKFIGSNYSTIKDAESFVYVKVLGNYNIQKEYSTYITVAKISEIETYKKEKFK